MSKIMVVEDDASLREIYSIRITAEGYDVVSAGDGEEGLAVAVREKPDLILADVMMPKISGFDMLDILRSTPETAGIKVIMMTALSAEDQRQRGERLGADRYLVKSQVGIEDVINAIHEVLGDRAAGVAQPVSMPADNTAQAMGAEQTMDAQAVPAQSMPEQPMAAQPMQAQPMMEQPAVAQPMPTQSMPEQAPVEQPMLAQPVVEQPAPQMQNNPMPEMTNPMPEMNYGPTMPENPAQ